MQGISFVIDEKGDKKAVLIDLDKYGDLWEDFSDVLVSQERKDENEIDWEDVKEKY